MKQISESLANAKLQHLQTALIRTFYRQGHFSDLSQWMIGFVRMEGSCQVATAPIYLEDFLWVSLKHTTD